MSGIKSTSYIRFLNFVNAVDERDTGKKLDNIEEQLLNQVMLAFSQGREVLVGDLLKMSNIGSQATLHGRVKNLIKFDYVKQVTDASDGRKKKLIPAKQALKHYAKLSSLIDRAFTA